MSARELDKLKSFYEAKSYFAVMDSNAIFFAESPEEQGLEPNDEQQESVLRLFVDREDADIYCEYVNITTGIDGLLTFKVTALTLRDLWHVLDDVDKISYYTFGCNVRVAFCTLDAEGWPVDLDTVHSNFAKVH